MAENCRIDRFYMRAHHEKNSRISSHAIKLNNEYYCRGCLVSDLFLFVIFPLIGFIFIASKHPLFSSTIDVSILLCSSVILASLFFTEISTHSDRIYILFSNLKSAQMIFLHLYLIFSSLGRVANYRIFLYASLILVSPQYVVYTYKILTKEEFTNPGLKLMTRIFFVTGYFFLILFAKNDAIIGVTVLAMLFIAFLKLRRLSDNVVSNNVLVVHGNLLSDDSPVPYFLRNSGFVGSGQYYFSYPSPYEHSKSLVYFISWIVLIALNIVGVFETTAVSPLSFNHGPTNSWNPCCDDVNCIGRFLSNTAGMECCENACYGRNPIESFKSCFGSFRLCCSNNGECLACLACVACIGIIAASSE